ncbi:MAG: hypothetical protein HKO76_04315 [Acidimicrobiia bacterium]|nr:hypothetical protein [Acidimicrobiia bacterium]
MERVPIAIEMMRMRWHATVWLGLGLVLALTGCGGAESGFTVLQSSPSTTTQTESASSELEAARARWQANGIDTYHLSFENDCGECGPDLIEPRQAVVWEGDLVDPTGQTMSVEAVLDSIDRAIAAGRSVEASYDAEYGYPTEVWIDREARAYDGGVHWILQGLTAGLPGDPASLGELENAKQQWRTLRPAAYEYRMSFICDCPFSGSMWIKVEGDQIIDWSTDFDERGEERSVSPLTMDDMFDDLADMFEAGSIEDSGVRFSGAAQYDAALGFPAWIGLDIEVVDPASELAVLAPRFIFVVNDFKPVAPQPNDHEHQDQVTARNRWDATGLEDYSYELSQLEVDGELPLNQDGSFKEPYVVSVVNGEIASVTQFGVESEVADVPIYTIPQLLTQIELWRQAGLKVDALYHTETGHPVIVSAFVGATRHHFFTIHNLEASG